MNYNMVAWTAQIFFDFCVCALVAFLWWVTSE